MIGTSPVKKCLLKGAKSLCGQCTIFPREICPGTVDFLLLAASGTFQYPLSYAARLMISLDKSSLVTATRQRVSIQSHPLSPLIARAAPTQFGLR